MVFSCEIIIFKFETMYINKNKVSRKFVLFYIDYIFLWLIHICSLLLYIFFYCTWIENSNVYMKWEEQKYLK